MFRLVTKKNSSKSQKGTALKYISIHFTSVWYKAMHLHWQKVVVVLIFNQH